MIILVTNDDGIHSEGLVSLEKSLAGLGDVWTVAPATEQNAMGRAITLHRPLKINKLSSNRFAVDGTPSDCVNIAANGILPERPALVVSGINKGPNLADDISYSGTVAAAFEATIMGIPAVAVSLACRDNFHFDPAARFTARLAQQILEFGLARDTLLNVNVPDTQGKEISSYKITHQGKSIYAGSVTEAANPRKQEYYWIGGEEVGFHEIDGSDSFAVARGCISITPITTDLTRYKELDALKKFKL